jgi:hypothetical protein
VRPNDKTLVELLLGEPEIAAWLEPDDDDDHDETTPPDRR